MALNRYKPWAMLSRPFGPPDAANPQKSPGSRSDELIAG
jgi:hypothetical protein